ncbi:MAG: sortase B protein-sorting domain-containing protein [Oscillospiraceae bacterium]|nr:sortase B protein-sorting domain-containing protein [Oscillospiraceae bacterium]
MKKAFLTFAVAAIFVVMLATPAFAASGDIVWQISAAEIEAYTDGGKGNDTAPWIKNCGGGSRAKEGNSIKFFDRTNDYDCIDIVTDGNLNAGTVYTAVAKVRTANGASTTFKYGMGSGPYTEYHAQTGANVTLTFKLDAANGFDFKKNLRIQTDGTTEDFFIDSIIIYEGDPPAASSGGGGGGAAKTGDSAMLALAAIAFALAAGAAVFVVRKVKA